MAICLTLKKSNCKSCFRCVRKCPVKAIRFSGNQAHIISNECILCGSCVVQCPQNAKEIADGTEKVFTYNTDAEKLGTYLEEQGLIDSKGADAGMFHTVDGEKADWNVNQSYWAFYEGEEYAMIGIYDTNIVDGATYKLVYTLG